jgi:hypothetical protein
MIPLLERHWLCPNCDSAAVTRDAKTPMHPCRGLAGLMVSLVPEGVRCKVEAVERGDYIGDEVVQADGNGRPVMAVVITRDDGQDCAVYAPLAQGSVRD